MERMAPGVLTRDGFLGNDARIYVDIIENDRAVMKREGIDEPALIAQLRVICDTAMRHLGVPIRVGRVTATYHEAMGRVPCPFGGCGTLPKGEIEISDENGEKILMSPLSVHMAEKHGFLGGIGNRYRLDPEILARMLGMPHK